MESDCQSKSVTCKSTVRKYDGRDLRYDTQQQLWDRFNRFRTNAKSAQDLQRARNDDDKNSNRDQIYKALQVLESTHNLGWGQDWLATRDLKEFEANAKVVSELFKTLKPLRKEDREELWNYYQKIWDKVRDIRDRKHKEWQQKQLEFRYKLESNIDKSKDFISKFRSQIDADYERQREAHSDNFRDVVQEWIDEKERKIAEVEKQIGEMQEKINDVNRKVYG